MHSIIVVEGNELKTHELHMDVEQARDRFKELIMEIWKQELSANSCLPVDDQCWKDILDVGGFEIRDYKFYLVEPIVKGH